MRIKALTLLIFIISFKLCAQDERKVFFGKVIADSVVIKDVHIINKSTKRGTISNELGEFAIPVKIQDTLVFSAVQFAPKELIVSAQILNKLQVIVNLKAKLNELEEVIVIKPESIAKKLSLPNADKKPLNKLDARLNYYSKASTSIVILTTLLGKAGGIEDLYYIFSGERKKDRKLKKLVETDKINDYNKKITQRIRLHFTDVFFINTLQIPEEQIDYFLDYCTSTNDILNMFNDERIIEVTDILIKESKPFLVELKGQ